jgi:predicted transglutaminase-like cysteine proteinase
MRWSIGLLSVLALAGCSSVSSTSSVMPTYGYAFPPAAFNDFCEIEPGLCASTSGEKVVELTDQRRAELERVNGEVNRSVAQRDDAPDGQRGDRWQVALTAGDCEDIAIRKKSELLKLGWSASSLLLTVARMPGTDTGHTVLTVRTSEGDLILDSLAPRIRPWSSTRYEYFARQSQEQHGQWEQIRS